MTRFRIKILLVLSLLFAVNAPCSADGGQTTSPDLALKNRVYFLFENLGVSNTSAHFLGASYERGINGSLAMRGKVDVATNSYTNVVDYRSEYDPEGFRNTSDREWSSTLWQSRLSMLLVWYPAQQQKVFPSIAIGPCFDWIQGTLKSYAETNTQPGFGRQKQDSYAYSLGMATILGLHGKLSRQLALHASWGLNAGFLSHDANMDSSGLVGILRTSKTHYNSDTFIIQTTRITFGFEFLF